MLKDAEEQETAQQRRKWSAPKNQSTINFTYGMKVKPMNPPIADFFPHNKRILLVTAVSSSKEPSQVTSLENITQAFDEIARRRRVFKVERLATVIAVWIA
jgi:hypothetical protein